MTRHIPEVAFWCLAAGALATLVLLVRQQRITAALRKRNARLEQSIGARDQEAQYLVDVRLPSIADSLYQSAPKPGLFDEQLAGTAFAHSLQGVLDHFAGAVEQAHARADQSAKAALKASMRAIQALANEQQLSISDMQERHDNPAVLQDLLEIDHANSQFGRRAQAIAVLCGSWPGRQRSASGLTDVVRGAKSRIRDYRRIQVHAQVDIAIVSRAVEPVVLAVAELLDNAARHSQPNTAVEVSLQPAHNGACIVIDDAGVGMDGHEVEKAGQLLSGRRAVDVTRLGDPPQFGFAVTGVLAERYGFSVSVDTRSPYGGVRAVLFLPSALLTHPDADGGRPRQAPRVAAPAPPVPPVPTPAPAPAPPSPAPAAAAHQPEPAVDPAVDPDTQTDPPAWQSPAWPSSTAGGLPKRRRRQPIADRAAAPDPGPDIPMRPAEETARRMGAFARGTRTGRAADRHDDDEGNPQA